MGAPQNQTAIVVGAGVGGVAIAARLAKAGYRVTVVEKNDFTGGRCSLIHDNGYRFDQGPSLLLLPELFHETFEDFDTTMEAEDVKLVKCTPNYEVYFDDGEQVTMSSDLTVMKEQIERYEGHDGFMRYLGFLQEAHQHYEVSVDHVLHKNFPTLLSLLRPSFLRYLIALHPFESVYYRASRYFRTERLQRVFTFSSMYMGMSPYDAPGTYSLLQYAELVRAIWYPIGGFHKVVEGIVNIGKRYSVNYRLSTPVQKINVSAEGRATGVTLETGEVLDASLVVCNADLVYSYNTLLPPSPGMAALNARETSCSSISFYWGLDGSVPELKTHNIFLAGDYRPSFDAIFHDHTLPPEPSFYVNVPSRVDPSAAPAGKDAVIVLLPIGHLLENGTGLSEKHTDWDAVIKGAREQVIRDIKARTGADIGPMIVTEQINTPMLWRDKFNLDKGGILGLSHSFFNVLSFRPATKHASIKDLYFVGASTHPGTGVPICLAGAKVTCEQILRDRGQAVPWPKFNPDVRRPSSSPLDVLKPDNVSRMFVAFFALVISVVALQLWNHVPAHARVRL